MTTATECKRCHNLEDILTRERKERAATEKTFRLNKERLRVVREELRELKAVVEFAHIQRPALAHVIELYLKDRTNQHIKKAIVKAGAKRADNGG